MRRALFIAILCVASSLVSLPVFGQLSITNGTACATGNSSFWDQAYVCDGSAIWRHPAFQFGTSGASCTSGTTGTAGMVQWTGSDLQYCNGSAWTSLGTQYLGTTTSAADPQRNGQATTGLYTAGAGLVDVTNSGTQSAEFSSTGLNIIPAAGGLKFNNTTSYLKLTAADTGGGSIALGYRALRGETTSGAYGNIAIGNSAISSTLTTAAIQNTAIGNAACQNLTSGSQNTCLGNNAGSPVTTGLRNTGLGLYAGAGWEAGSNDNVAIGEASLQGNPGSENTAVGGVSMASYATGNGNTAIGWASNGGVGNYNVAIGSSSGGTITTGTNNTLLGQAVADSTLQTGSSNILIGVNSDVPTSSTSSFLNIYNTVSGGMTAPILSSCGTSPSLNGMASDIAGTVTTGTGATACTVTFADTRGYAPSCIVSNRAGSIPAFTTSMTALTISSIAASAVFDYICFGP